MLRTLKKGSTIGIVNPSFKNKFNDNEIGNNSLVGKRYQKVIDYLTKLGYIVKLGKTFSLKNGYLAGTDEQRASDLMDMFKDKDVDMILCMRGGYGATRMVDLLDFDVIKQNPKLICGYSDITVLLNSIYQKCNFPTIHGLIGLYFDGEHDSFSVDDFFSMTKEKQLNRVLKNPNDYSKVLNPGVCEGKLVGGNLSLICALQGTPYEIDFTDKIVFIEDVGEDPYRIDRYLSMLKLSHQLEKAKGFVFGYFTDCVSEENQTIMDLLNDYILPLNKPTIYNFSCGHSFPFVNLPIGTTMRLDTEQKSLKIMEEIYE